MIEFSFLHHFEDAGYCNCNVSIRESQETLDKIKSSLLFEKNSIENTMQKYR